MKNHSDQTAANGESLHLCGGDTDSRQALQEREEERKKGGEGGGVEEFPGRS